MFSYFDILLFFFHFTLCQKDIEYKTFLEGGITFSLVLQKCFWTFKRDILWNILVEGEGQGCRGLCTAASGLPGNTASVHRPLSSAWAGVLQSQEERR